MSAELVFADRPSELLDAKYLWYDVTPSKQGDVATVELKISALSSQNEGSLFRVVFHCQVSESDKVLSVTSEPIKIVSKKSQLEKGKPKRTRTTQVATREAVLNMLDTMREQREADQLRAEQMMQQQTEQSQLLKQLMGKLDTVTETLNQKQQQPQAMQVQVPGQASDDLPPLFLPAFSPPAPRNLPGQKWGESPLKAAPAPSIQEAWNQLLQAYKATQPTKRAQQLGMCARNATTQDFNTFQEMAVLASLEQGALGASSACATGAAKDKNMMLDFGLATDLVPMDLELDVPTKDFYMALME